MRGPNGIVNRAALLSLPTWPLAAEKRVFLTERAHGDEDDARRITATRALHAGSEGSGNGVYRYRLTESSPRGVWAMAVK